VIESSDTGQASIVFMGRDSFRMQVTEAGAIPSTLWDGGTARIIERRKHDRRHAPRVAPVPQEESLPPTPARNTIIGIALMTFACGVMVATAFNQFPRRAGSPVQAAAATPALQAPAVVVQPLPKPAPAPAPMVAPAPAAPIPEVAAQAEGELQPEQPEQPAVVAKAKPAARVVAARAVHPRRPAPSPSTQATGAAASETPPAAPRPARPWVDPFAD